jgi:lipocalin-like protein
LAVVLLSIKDYGGKTFMIRRGVLGITAMAGLGLVVLLGNAMGQQKSPKEQLLGTWTLVSIEAVRPDGNRLALFGPRPRGIAMFDGGGHYIISVMRSDLPAFAINDRMQGTAEEYKAATQGAITYFGTYSVSEADRTLLIHIDGSSFPNWNGNDQKRLFVLTEQDLKLTVPPAPTGGGTIEVVWKRAH